MSSRIARLVSDQQVTLDDFDHLAKDPRNLADVLGKTAISAGRAYFGGTLVKTSTTRVAVETPLGLYDTGAIYTRDAEELIEIDLLSALPTTGNQKVVALVISGQEISDETEERDFRVGVSNNVIQTEARPTATRLYRRASIATVQGVQAPQPSRPVVDSALTVLGWVTLSSTEILTVEQNVEDRLNSIAVVDGRVKIIEAWKAETEPAVQGLKSDVSKLLANSNGKVDRRFQGYLLEQLARLNERVGVDPAASYSFTDYFLSLEESNSDEEHINFLAKVEEGIRFDDDNLDTTALSLLTPGDPSIQISNTGLLLPKYAEIPLLSVKGRDAEVAVSNGGSQTINYVLKTISKTRIRYGASFLICTNAQWWKTGRYDSVKGVFYKDGVEYAVEFAEQHPSNNALHSVKRLRQIFIDSYEEPYWSATTVAASYNGQVAGNTFMVPRSAWVTGFNIGFSRRDAGGGDVRLGLCEVNDSGAPDYGKVLAVTTVVHANVKVWPAMTKFSIEPIYLEGGKRYAWFIITPGNHWLAMVEGNKYAQGTFFVSTDGAWSQGNIAQDACFEVLAAEFEASRLVVNLNNWNLSGGLTDIDLMLMTVAKEGAFYIQFEVQVGAVWVPLAEVASGNSPLYGLPASLNARMILIGTTDVMPGIKLAESTVTRSRPRVAGVHISGVQTAPANVDEVHIIAVLEHYIEANHDCVVALMTGVGYATVTAAASVTDEAMPDGSTRRTWVFTGFTPTTTWKRRTTMATTSALSVYLVSEMTDVGFPA